MKQPITFPMLVITLLTLLSFLGFQLWEHDPPAARPSMPAATELATDLPTQEELPQFSLPPVEKFSETLTRPLFFEGRQPPDLSPADSLDPQAPSQSKSTENPTLSAIVLASDEQFVLVKDPGKQSLRRVEKGEDIAGWSLDEIRSESVRLTREGRTKVVTLWQFQPPPKQAATRRRGSGITKQTLQQRRQTQPQRQRRVKLDASSR